MNNLMNLCKLFENCKNCFSEDRNFFYEIYYAFTDIGIRFANRFR